MNKYRKKPVVIEAKQWFNFEVSDPDHQMVIHYARTGECPECEEELINHGQIKTLEGWHIVCPGDWIIKGVEGEFYPCKPGIFEKTYDVVDCDSA